ncbi:MAG: D-alanyl-D-alanine carboxypeptidase [Ruminococcaceae bacterium]|nr:D-alanyl-D-alanine carboxypeptidase [Oscillospiraceae bacterium]
MGEMSMKKTVIFLLTSIIFLSILTPITCYAEYNDSINLRADIACMICVDNDEAIFNKNYNKKSAPASLTKIMTALVALDRCEDLQSPVVISQYAIDSLVGTDSSTAGLVPGEKVTMYDLLNCLLVKSANEAAIAIAEYVGGSVPAFLDMMNKKAKDLGCIGTNYVNVHGLDQDGQYTTAHDMYLICKEAMKNPVFKKIVGQTSYTMPKTNMNDERILPSTNFMINSNYTDCYVPYATGIKTGTTDDAGRCFITMASKNGYNYIAIVMGVDPEDAVAGENAENIAFIECKKMIEWTFANIRYKVVAQENEVITVLDVKYSWATDFLELVPSEDVAALVPSNLDASSVYIQPDTDTPEFVKAPVKKGEKIGTATVYYAGEEIATVDMVASKNVSRSIILALGGAIETAWNSVIGKIIFILLILLAGGYIGYTVFINKKSGKKARR